MIEKIILDAATNIAKRGAITVAHDALGTVNKALGKSYERKRQMIRDEFSEAIIMQEMVNHTVKKHLLGRELVSKVSYLNEEYKEEYTVVGKLEAPVHVLILNHRKLPVGTVTEIPQDSTNEFKAEVAYKGKHFVNVFYKVEGNIVRNYIFDDSKFYFRWLNKAETNYEVLYKDKIIMRKKLNKYIITQPENEEKCMLLAMAFLSAESPRGRVTPPARL